MQLLDASLAFVLTLAALATVVTTIMEACFRTLKMRKKNLIQIMKLLNNEISKGSLKMNPKERWEFICKVVENPAESTKLIHKINWKENDKENEDILSTFLLNFGKRGDRKGVFNKVSLEYVLRCLSENETVKCVSLESGERLKTELNRIARKYEEFGSAVSSTFKQYAQAWSIWIGIILALAANVDGIRIFEAYRADPKLALAVIEKQESWIEKSEEVQSEMNNLTALMELETNAKRQIESAKKAQKESSEIEAFEAELADILEKIAEKTEVSAIQKTLHDAKTQVADLRAMGIPIGWKFYPNCPFGKEENEWLKACPECKAFPESLRKAQSSERFYGLKITIKNDIPGFVVWLLKVILTGVLIGLGAPFWFDVAKRMSAIRTGLKNPNSSDEDRLSARDANGDADERKKIVDDVVSDIRGEAAASVLGQVSRLTGPRRIVL